MMAAGGPRAGMIWCLGGCLPDWSLGLMDDTDTATVYSINVPQGLHFNINITLIMQNKWGDEYSYVTYLHQSNITISSLDCFYLQHFPVRNDLMLCWSILFSVWLDWVSPPEITSDYWFWLLQRGAEMPLWQGLSDNKTKWFPLGFRVQQWLEENNFSACSYLYTRLGENFKWVGIAVVDRSTRSLVSQEECSITLKMGLGTN